MPTDNNIVAVLLAAGASRRFGIANKLLTPIDGKMLVARVLDALVGAGVEHIVVVTGCDREAVEQALQGRAVRFVHNPDWEEGMGRSIGVGVAALNTQADGVMIVPGDVPLLTAPLIGKLIEAFDTAGGNQVVYPMTEAGEQRNPVIWPRRLFAVLKSLPSAEGAKSLLRSLSQSERFGVGVGDDAALSDVDTPAELDAVRDRLLQR